MAAHILEPPVSDTDALKTIRNYVFISKGLSNNPEQNVSAIKGAALQILNIDALTNHARETALNVGMVDNGSKLSVDPNEAQIGIDIRASLIEEQKGIDEYFAELDSMDARIITEVEGGINRPSMEQT